MSLTIAYVTARKEPRVRWLLDSLRRQCEQTSEWDWPEIVIVSPYGEMAELVRDDIFSIKTVPPKPTVWSGPHRLTSKDYWSAANARNTAAALCETDWIAYVDDLSVLGPDWLEGVRDAMDAGLIGLGCYQKVNKLVVENGLPVSFEEFPHGIDSRRPRLGGAKHVPISGSSFFGCSLAMPIEALLDINGWPENLSDSLGFEDCLTGHVLENRGYSFRYDSRMFTLEADDEHGAETPMVRWDPGDSPRDMSHKALEIALSSNHFDNDFGQGMNLRELRARVLRGEPFPIRTTPQNHWFTGQLLSEL